MLSLNVNLSLAQRNNLVGKPSKGRLKAAKNRSIFASRISVPCFPSVTRCADKEFIGGGGEVLNTHTFTRFDLLKPRFGSKLGKL